jgi:hypothetical protein
VRRKSINVRCAVRFYRQMGSFKLRKMVELMSHFERNYFGERQVRMDDVVFLENGMVVDCLDSDST